MQNTIQFHSGVWSVKNTEKDFKLKKQEKVFPWQPLAKKIISSNSVGTWKAKTHKNICKSKKQKKLPWQHLLPVIVKKLISFNPCRGLECKEPQKNIKAQET